MEDSPKKSSRTGRPKTPVRERIQNFLDVDIRGEIPNHVRDQHWIWGGAMHPPKLRKRYNKHRRSTETNEGFIMPARIRDEDNQLRAVIRVLFRELRGTDYPYPPKRSHGCDYRCVNPWHLSLPEGLNESEFIPPTEEPGDDIDGLVEEIGAFIGMNGRDDNAIRSRFLIDYTDEEINTALARL